MFDSNYDALNAYASFWHDSYGLNILFSCI